MEMAFSNTTAAADSVSLQGLGISTVFGNETKKQPTTSLDAFTVNLVSTIIYSYVIPVLFVFGTIGNVLSLVVLCADKKRNTTTMILMALAISDLGNISTRMVRLVSHIMEHFDADLALTYKVIMLTRVLTFNFIMSRITAIITTLISVERCTAVLFPLKVNIIFTPRRVFIILVSIFIGCFALLSPLCFISDYKWVVNPLTNASSAVYVPTKFYIENKKFISFYSNVFLNVVIRIAPGVIVGFNTATIIIKLKKASAWRQGMAKSSDQMTTPKDNKLTIMLVTLCVLFFVCTLPGLILMLLKTVSSKFVRFGQFYSITLLLADVSMVTEYFNSCINFVIYMALNTRFAKTFKQIFGCRNKGE